ncbi:four-carbon acid sugar kinase family protein [Novosphingobium kaempferiae]|uniref:four-carbon acid sugar kinase family protein n=1 Tax=Novosphingobium kaempferiae TaxID=2896849 RepID=UPI001E5B468E|nr:four-carbon acid sugar kinase family protein [Novosphingobium kaempferiae]
MVSVLVMADDLTGALDSAAAFCGPDRRVAVAVDRRGIADARACDPHVLAVNTDTRALRADAAAGIVADLWGELADLAPRIVFKKVDSRLQGHAGHEAAALAMVSGRAEMLVCPAVPDMGRVVAGAQLCGTGIERPIELSGHFPPGSVVDAAGEAALDHLAARIVAAGDRTLAVGARGLARAVARALHRDAGDEPRPLPPLLPMAVAVGSRDRITDAQVTRLIADVRDAAYVAAPGGKVPACAIEDVAALLVQLVDDGTDLPEQVAAARFARGIARIVEQWRPRSLLLSGGATALAVLDALGIRAVLVQGEAAPAIPLCSAPRWPDMQILTKSGGFGEPAALSALVAGAAQAGVLAA